MLSNLLKKLSILFGTLLLVGCLGSQVSSSNFDKIEEGMSMDRVKTILGEPSSFDSSPAALGTTAIWESEQLKITIVFVGDKVERKKLVTK